MRTNSFYLLAGLVAIALAGCAAPDPNAPHPTTYSSSYLSDRCFNGHCHAAIAYQDITIWPRSAPQYYLSLGGGIGGGLFPDSIEQRLGVAPNECFVDVPVGPPQQVACVLNRPVKRYIDTAGGRGVVFQN